MIPHSRPAVGEEEKRACCAVLDSLQLAQGEKVAEFERAFAGFVNRRYAAAVSSGTAALTLALRALDLSAKDEVLIPSYQCAALLHAVAHAGARPVLVDIDLEDFNLSVDDVKKKMSRRAKAVIIPHSFGRAGRVRELLKLGIPVIEDGTQALGAHVGEPSVGSFGVLSVFSFYATKMITTGEGGMVLTDSKRLAGRILDGRDYDKKETHHLRTNSKMTDLAAAIGIEQLKKLPFFIERRRQIAGQYARNLGGLGFILPQEGEARDHVYYRYVVRIPKKLKAVMKNMESGGVEVKRPVFKPLHRYLNYPDAAFPAASRAMAEACSLPIFPSLSLEDCGHVCRMIQSAAAQPDSAKVVLCKDI